MTTYPYSIDPSFASPSSLLRVVDGVTSINSALFKEYADCIIALETELGVKPSGTYSTVRQRLDEMELGIGALGTISSAHSTTIATMYKHNWISPTSLGDIVYSCVGQAPINLRNEAGFTDGYGYMYFINRFFVDSDGYVELSLWDMTSTPTQLIVNGFGPGEHTWSVLFTQTIVNYDRIFELRARQTSSLLYPANYESNIWNSRILFIPANQDSIRITASYIIMPFTYNDILLGTLDVGAIPQFAMVQSAVVIIDSGFDGATTIEIGDTGVSNRLMATTDNTPAVIGDYSNSSNYEYLATETIKATFTGTPTTGSGAIIIYYH